MTGITRPGAGWRKPRRSMGNGNCAEVGTWRTSSRTYGGGNCVEAAEAIVPSGVLVRDTKDRDGTVLAYPASAWRAFTAGLKAGAQ